MNWYYADYNESHTTRDFLFKEKGEAIDFFLSTYKNVETIYKCKEMIFDYNDSWEAPKEEIIYKGK